MPRQAKGPRLWKRLARKRNGRVIARATWLIKDAGKHIATGCAAGKAEREPPAAAQKALADYIAGKCQPPRVKQRDVDQIDIADVLSIYHSDKREDFQTEEAAKKFDGRINRLNDFFGGTMLGALNSQLCKNYTKERGNKGGSRRDLEDLRAAIGHHARENLHNAIVHVWLPEKGEARDRWLTRQEAAKLIWAAWRAREVQKGEKTEKLTLQHIARFTLIGAYSGTRAGAIATASPTSEHGRSYVDLDRGIYYRRARGRRITNKRQPPVPLAPRLLAHLRRWHRLGIITTHFIEWNGKPVKSVKNGFRRAVKLAELSLKDGNVTPHTLRHTAATWLMQRGADPWQASGYLGMSLETLLMNYGHHHPDYMREAAEAITKQDRNANVSVVESVVSLDKRRAMKRKT